MGKQVLSVVSFVILVMLEGCMGKKDDTLRYTCMGEVAVVRVGWTEGEGVGYQDGRVDTCVGNLGGIMTRL
jgi:hypothetical protein